MNYGRFAIGLVLLIIGILILGSHFGWWNDQAWISASRLWPLILIFLGIGIIFGAENPISSILFLIIALAAFAYLTNTPVVQRIENRSTDSEKSTPMTKNFENNAGSISKANFEISLGAANIEIRKLENNEGRLYSGSFSDSQNFSTKESIVNDSADIKMLEEWNGFPSWNKSWKRDFSLFLSTNPVYTISLNSGASNLNLDLSDLKVSNLKISAGASKQEIRFGDSEKNVTAEISAGASSIKIYIPTNFGVKIVNESALTSNNFEDLQLSKSGKEYTSSGFDTAEKKLTLSLKTGVSSVNIERY